MYCILYNVSHPDCFPDWLVARLGGQGLFTFTNALPCDLPWAPPWLPWPGMDRVGSTSTWLVETAPSQRFSTRSERWKCAMRPPRPPRCTGATLRAFLRRTGLDLTSPAAHAINHRPNTLPQVLTLQDPDGWPFADQDALPPGDVDRRHGE